MSTHPSRRNFLGAAAGAAGLTALSPVIASATIEPEPWGIKLGIATYSLRSFYRPTAIAMLKKLQAKYVSIKDVHLSQTLPPQTASIGWPPAGSLAPVPFLKVNST